MDSASSDHITRLLNDASAGREHASEDLLPLLYEELRQLAQRRMAGEPAGLTLQPTALVHEAYLRLIGDRDIRWDSRAHFFGAAAQAMRRILVERARRHARVRHGGGLKRLPLDNVDLVEEAPTDDLLALDEALSDLEARDERKARVVMLRYFAGLTIEETASAMGVSPATVKNEWSFARAWLYSEIRKGEDQPD